MARKILLELGEHYHIYNRGVDKRDIILDNYDKQRFLTALIEFNTQNPIGSIYEKTRIKKLELKTPNTPLVKIICFSINPNHFHLLLQQITKKGIEKFVHRLTMGFSKYFNNKYDRKGALFQGSFGSSHIDSNEYLLYLSVYINLNDQIHLKHQQFGHGVSKLGLGQTSWPEYFGKQIICNSNIILDQFSSLEEYKKFSLMTLETIRENKILEKELEYDEMENNLDTPCPNF